MRSLKLLLIIILVALPALASDIRSGEDLVTAMHKKYAGRWYKTLTFVQTTTNYKPDGTPDVSTWYEAMQVPSKLRIDFTPLDKHDGIIFADNKLYSYRDGKEVANRPFVHPLLVLGFDVYAQPVETTIALIKGMNIDLSVIHEEEWQGRSVYVVGAKQGDLRTPQFWVDKKELYFVRMFDLAGKDKSSVHETQFNDYKKAKGGGWVSAEVKFFVDGKLSTMEQYADIQTNVPLAADLWEPEKWMTADRTYFKIKP